MAAPGQWLASRNVTRVPSTKRGELRGTVLDTTEQKGSSRWWVWSVMCAGQDRVPGVGRRRRGRARGSEATADEEGGHSRQA
jgi:hypothetical protein